MEKKKIDDEFDSPGKEKKLFFFKELSY